MGINFDHKLASRAMDWLDITTLEFREGDPNSILAAIALPGACIEPGHDGANPDRHLATLPLPSGSPTQG